MSDDHYVKKCRTNSTEFALPVKYQFSLNTHTHTPINHDKTFYVVVSLSIQIYVYYLNNFDYAYQGYECKKGVIFL